MECHHEAFKKECHQLHQASKKECQQLPPKPPRGTVINYLIDGVSSSSFQESMSSIRSSLQDGVPSITSKMECHH
ncbi:hypothetical protein V6N13_048395 [Hibiscus sabdariffa]